MAVNVLETKELLELSLLKCKVCGARLQSPVLQVGVFGNVCGSCCDRSVYTEVVRNVDLEALLQKLYLPCNYAERGCDFVANFDDVCIHETRCPFRKKECPLACYDKCENGLKYIDDMIEHMKSEHPDKILTAVENYVSAKNPIVSDQDVFYLLLVDNMNFILRARLDVNKGHILYAFYSLNYDLSIEDVKLSIVLKYENTFCNVENININRLDKGELPSKFNEEDAIKLKLATLENFECLDSITIRVNIERNIGVKKKSAGSIKTPRIWSKCPNCLKFSDSFYYCNKLETPIYCGYCELKFSRCKCGVDIDAKSIHTLVKLANIKSASTFLCKNVGCNEEISGDHYFLHTRSQCRFRQCDCPFSTNTSCTWKGVFMDLAAHITTNHTDRVNQHSCQLPNSTDILGELCFIKKNNTFMQTYKISEDQLVVTTKKLDKSNYGDGYIWQIYFKHPVKGYETVISDIFTGDECEKRIDVKGFASDDPFTFQVLFRKINSVLT